MSLPHKLLRTIRLDSSDGFVFEPAAAPGEWAVPGGFMFWDCDPRQLAGRARQAFRSGFLGLSTFGWSTLAVVVEATDDERDAAVAALAMFLRERQGAPSMGAAMAAAREEMAFAAELAAQPVQTLVALHRAVRDDGSVTEQFRTLHTHADAKAASQMPCSAGAFAIVEDDAPADAATSEMFDLVDLARGRSAGQP